MEAWTEVNLVTVRVQDEDVLELVDAIVHDQLAGVITTWFYFWEPELRLQIRWREPERRAEHAATLARILDEWKARRRIKDWFEGAHGVPRATYVGEAEQYGADVWPRLQQDWMSGSELALQLIKLDRTKSLPYPRGVLLAATRSPVHESTAGQLGRRDRAVPAPGARLPAPRGERVPWREEAVARAQRVQLGATHPRCRGRRTSSRSRRRSRSPRTGSGSRPN